MGGRRRRDGLGPRGGVALLLVLLLGACASSGPEVPAPADPDPLGPRLAAPGPSERAAYVAQLRELGVDQYLGSIQPATQVTRGDWTVYEYTEASGAACMDGSPFRASLRPASAPTGEVMLYLQGGGACWNADNCFGVPMATTRATVPGSRTGIFDWTDPANPVAGHDIVFASYCDGSVWSGDRISSYGARHWGLRNLSAALDLLKDTTGTPERLVIVGSSAGGFGTLMAAGVARVAFPEAELWVLNDSGPGIENPRLRDGMGREIREHWGFTRFMPPECTACDEQLTWLIGHQLDRDDRLRVAMFSYREDYVIGSLFLQLYSAYAPLLREVTDRLHDRHPERFRRFFVEGGLHTIVSTRAWSAQWPHGQRFRDWFGAFLANSPDWIDRR